LRSGNTGFYALAYGLGRDVLVYAKQTIYITRVSC